MKAQPTGATQFTESPDVSKEFTAMAEALEARKQRG